MKQLVIAIAVLALARGAAAQTADDYRGGWRTAGGEAHTYEFSIRGATVRGVYCTYCADATTLAFVDGTFGPDGIRFEVTHVNADGSPTGMATPSASRSRAASSAAASRSVVQNARRSSTSCAAAASTSTLASVMTASVVSGSISETAPTSVVLPTPKPPAMTIFAEVVAALEST